MRYKRKPCVVEAFRFNKDVEVNAPPWFGNAIEEEKVFIDRCINDGVMRVYGCTIHTKRGRLKAKVGDYIILEKSGEIKICKEKEFKEQYERM